MRSPHETKARAAVAEAAAYLRSCGIRLPRYRVTAAPPEDRNPFGGSYVIGSGGTLRLNMGRYPTQFLRHWFAMHELGHVLWHLHRPLRWKRFREAFGEPAPENYDEVHQREAWKTALSKGSIRPDGEPSFYGARAGGEERFCELLGFIYARGDFSMAPPDDLADLWHTCWNHGLSRMI
jgi:hypothetical protein